MMMTPGVHSRSFIQKCKYLNTVLSIFIADDANSCWRRFLKPRRKMSLLVIIFIIVIIYIHIPRLSILATYLETQKGYI